MATPAADRVVANRYLLEVPLGRGGMGVVWRARDTVLGRSVAVKEVVLPPSLPPSERGSAQARVMREARAAARLNHASAVTLYDVVRDQGHTFIVMELVEAPTLADVVRDEGPLPPRKVAEIGVQLAGALEAAHRAGIVHRDVKPGNVMVTEDGGVKLADFGIASVQGDPRLTTTGLVIGSPAYMAPEQARGELSGPPADFWALGATLYAAVEGMPPFDKGASIPTLAAVVNEDPRPMHRAGPLAPVIAALLSKDPTHRPSGPEVRAQLQPLAGALSTATDVLPATTAPLPVVPPTPTPTPTPPTQPPPPTPSAERTPPAPPPPPAQAPPASPPAAAAGPPPAPAAPAAEPEPPAEAEPPAEPEPAAEAERPAEAEPPGAEPAAEREPPAQPLAEPTPAPEPAAPPSPAAEAEPSAVPAAEREVEAPPAARAGQAPPAEREGHAPPAPPDDEAPPAEPDGRAAAAGQEGRGAAAGQEGRAGAGGQGGQGPAAERDGHSAVAGEERPEWLRPAGAAGAALPAGAGAPGAGPPAGPKEPGELPEGVLLERPSGTRRGPLIGVVGGLVIVAVLVAWLAGAFGSRREPGSPTATTAAAARPETTAQAPSTRAPSTKAPTTQAPATTAAGQLPAGWTSFSRSGGAYAVGVPPGWRERTRGRYNATVVEDERGDRVFTVRSTNPANPLPDASRQYRDGYASNLPGYRQVRFDERGSYQGRPAVVFEYEFVDSGRRVHVRHVNLKGRTWGYNVEFVTPVEQWEGSQELARQFEQAFRPRG